MKVVKNLLLVITWLLLIYTSFELGMWQLHRAQDNVRSNEWIILYTLSLGK